MFAKPRQQIFPHHCIYIIYDQIGSYGVLALGGETSETAKGGVEESICRRYSILRADVLVAIGVWEGHAASWKDDEDAIERRSQQHVRTSVEIGARRESS